MFEKGDKLLIEIDGVNSNPGKLGSDDPLLSINWKVVYNSGREIIIANEFSDQRLVLEIGNIVHESPAVFETESPLKSKTKKVMIIPKMVGYYLPESEEYDYFGKFKKVAELSSLRNTQRNVRAAICIVYSFIKKLNRFGWDFNSVNRFALRSGIDVNTVFLLNTKNLNSKEEIESIYNESIIDYDNISKMYKAMMFYSSFWKYEGLETGVDEERVIDLPKWNKR